MGELVLLESELINVYENSEKERIIDAKELHEYMEVGTRYNDWITRKLEKYEFEEGLDFYSVLSKSNGGRPSTDYYLKIDTAKEIAMVENNSKGRLIRKYFIEVEKRYSQQVPMTMEDLIIHNAQLLKETRLKQEEHDRKLKLMESNVVHLETKIDNSVVKDGYRTGSNVARELKLFSNNNKPHSLFLDFIAKHLGIYNSQLGYTDEYIQVVQGTSSNGISTSVTYFSEQGTELIKEFLDNNFKLETTEYKKGDKKGQINKIKFTLMNKGFEFNEITYKHYQ